MEYTPFLSILTALFEFTLFIWSFSIKKKRGIVVPAAIILLLLANYQILEVIVCQYESMNIFAKIAFFNITWLPPVGILLVRNIRAKKSRIMNIITVITFAAALFFAISIFLIKGFITHTVCEIVFSTYKTDSYFFYQLYGGYYLLSLTLMLFAAMFSLYGLKKPRKYLMLDFLAGSLAFILFSLITVLSVSSARIALPSVQCHMALFLAISIFSLLKRLKK